VSQLELLSVEERLALLEQRLGLATPQAVVPPITVGSLTNVPVPGSQIAAQWAQDVTGYVVHRFASKASLVAWAAAAVGAFAVQTDNGVLWRKVAGGWSQQTPWTGHALGSDWSFADTAPRKVAAFNIPADPAPRRATLHITQRVDLVVGNTATVDLAVDGVTQTSVFVDARSDANPPSVPFHVHNAAPSAGNVSIPTGRAVEVAIWVTPSAAFTCQVYASHSRIDALVGPQGY
jgi:hypothetical protein